MYERTEPRELAMVLLVNVCVDACERTYVCVYMWRSEDDVECPPQSLPTLYLVF